MHTWFQVHNPQGSNKPEKDISFMDPDCPLMKVVCFYRFLND